ncbi:MAG: hypothetical protein KAV00_03885, partial [Phycisphaerae bacterium]|nr:hypothetical protein [Phycisphaerae bacterium]
RVTIEANCANGLLMQYIAQHARTTGEEYHESNVTLEATISEKHLAKLNAFGEDVKIVKTVKTGTV